ncbi:hypothetical protein ACFE04_018550 [Oxalis oulophora]
MASSVFLYHVVGDLTVGKPEFVEFYETETVESAIQAIADSTECGIPVWKKKTTSSSSSASASASGSGIIENTDMRLDRFVGILDSFAIVAFLARNNHCLEDHDEALNTPVSQLLVPNNSLLKLVDPATSALPMLLHELVVICLVPGSLVAKVQLIDALEMMKQGVRRLLVPRSVVWRGLSKRFSVLYNGKWLKNINTSGSSHSLAHNPSSSSTAIHHDKFCILSREDVIRFLIDCLGALAPLPLSSISYLGIINSNYTAVQASCPALEATWNLPGDPSAVAVVEPTSDGQCKIIGEISASKLWKSDYLAAAWALSNRSAGHFVMGIEDNTSPRSLPDYSVNSTAGAGANGIGSTRLKKFSSGCIGFVSNPGMRSMYRRGRSAPLTCKTSSSLAAVMAQMLSHRATHVWVTLEESEDVLVGVVGYSDILIAVTKQPPATSAANKSYETFVNEIQT